MFKNLKQLILKRIVLKDEDIVYFFTDIQENQFPNLKFLDISNASIKQEKTIILAQKLIISHDIIINIPKIFRICDEYFAQLNYKKNFEKTFFLEYHSTDERFDLNITLKLCSLNPHINHLSIKVNTQKYK